MTTHATPEPGTRIHCLDCNNHMLLSECKVTKDNRIICIFCKGLNAEEPEHEEFDDTGF